MTVDNFGAGPGVLPKPVLEQVQRELLNFQGTSGMSLLEMSHRSPAFQRVLNQSTQRLRDLLHLPEDYHVLYLQNGATGQFSSVPMNLLLDLHDRTASSEKALFCVTGTWSRKAHQECSRIIGQERSISFSLENQPSYQSSTDNIGYLYYCENETVDGVELSLPPSVLFPNLYSPNVPVVCDMSSNILSRPIPHLKEYSLIFAGAQKNLGPAGLTLVIIRDDLLQKHREKLHKHCIPVMMDYLVAQQSGSLYNTPPVFSIYVAGLVLEWLYGDIGGLKAIEELNRSKSSLLYGTIDKSSGFYVGVVKDLKKRSRMNVTFRIARQELEPEFLKLAEQEGLVCLAGHRSVGGLRASLYNALDLESVQRLVDFMAKFQLQHSS